MKRTTSIILANLTVAEDARFHHAKVPYSGSTGPHAAPESYGGDAPYIATMLSELGAALKAIGWHHIFIDASSRYQWIVRKCETSSGSVISERSRAHGRRRTMSASTEHSPTPR